MKCLPPAVVVALAVIVSLALTGPVHAGNESVAKMAVRAAKSDLESGYLDQAETQLDKAAEACDGLDDAVKAPILKEVETLRPQVAAARVKRKQDEIIRMLDRYIGGAKGQIDEERGLLDHYDQEVERSETALTKEAPNLDPKDVARLRAELDAVKKQGAVVGLMNKLNKITWTFDKVDRSRGAGDYSGAEESLKEIETILKDFPAGDARTKPVIERVAKTRTEMADALAASNKQHREEKVKPAIENWQKVLKDNAAADTETASIENFRSSTSIGEATIRRIRDIDSWFSWQKETIKEFESDAELKAVAEQAKKMRADDAEKLCKMFGQIMETIDKQPVGERDKQYEASSQVLSAVSSLEEYTAGAPSRDTVFAAAKTYSAKWTAERVATKKAADEKWEAMRQQAHQTWAGWEKDFPAGDFNPLECVQNMNAWKGKTIVLKDLRNRSGWDYRGQFDVITPVNGSPVACNYNPEIVKAADTLHDSIGYTFGAQDIYALAGVVKGTVQVERIEYIRALDQYISRGTIEAPLIEIVAMSSGPLAARVGYQTAGSTAGGGSVAAGAVGGAPSAGSSGFLGWTWRVLGVLLCVVAGLACMTRAKAVLVPQMAELAQVEAKVGKQNVDMMGLALATLGLMWLLVGLIYRDLLPAAALMAAGIFLAQDFLLLKGILKEPMASKLRPLGAIVGLACITLGVLHLILGGFPLV